MLVADAQREVRTVFRGGFVGGLVSGVLWLASGTAAQIATPRVAIVILVVGGFFIFPLTTLGLRILGGPHQLGPTNPLTGLGMQVAFVLPSCLPLVAAAASHHLYWFYPAFMVALGAHYLPFVFLYGMPMFWLLGFGLVALGVGLAHRPDLPLGVPALITGALLLVFGFLGRAQVQREQASAAVAPK
jgi:hypothetical protein